MSLEDLGWDPTLAFWAEQADDPSLVPGRLAAIDRGRVMACAASGTFPATWRFPLPVVGEPEGVMPAVGDWGLMSATGEVRKLVTLLPRRSLLARGLAGGGRLSQPLAANVDLMLIVTGLDGDFSPRRIERFVALARSCAIRAVVVLSKLDLEEDAAAAIEIAQGAAPGVGIVPLSSVTGEGLSDLEQEIGSRSTVALVGSSGAGKSTLINRLLGEDRQRTGAVRRSDDRGRHITTRRELLALPRGGLIIDTPGLREVGILNDEEALLEVFPEIARAATGCRYGDCTHRDEPDCAVRAAVEEGEIASDRLDSFHRLNREQQSARRRENEHHRRAHERSTMGHYRKQMRAVRRFKGQE